MRNENCSYALLDEHGQVAVVVEVLVGAVVELEVWWRRTPSLLSG